jgi:malonyl-CoA O-methyltransferase
MPILDVAALRRGFDRASAHYEQHAVIQARARDELLSRLSLLAFKPRHILDLGCGTGQGVMDLRQRFKSSRVTALDSAQQMLAVTRSRGSFWSPVTCVLGDAQRLPFKTGSIDLVFSNFLVPFSPNLDALMREVRRVLSPRGYWTFSALGPDTLKELRAAFLSAGRQPPIHPLFDMHDVGDALGRAGFADPVMDVDRCVLTYTSLMALHQDLKGMGARSGLATRSKGLLGRQAFTRIESHYQRSAVDTDGRLMASCEIIYGQAWCPGSEPPIRGRRQETVIPLSALQRTR